MKRTSFSAVVTALSFLIVSGSAVTAQDFPSTGEGAFNTPIQAAGQLMTSLLPPMYGNQDPSLDVAPGALPTAQPSSVVAPPVPQQVQVAPQQIQVAPQQVQALPQQIQVAPQRIQLPQQARSTPQTYLLPPAANVGTPISSAPGGLSSAPIYVQQSRGEVFSTPDNIQSFAAPTAPSYTPSTPQAYAAPAAQSVVTTNGPYASQFQTAPNAQSTFIQSPVDQQVYSVGNASPESFQIDDSQLLQGNIGGNLAGGILPRPKRGCQSGLAGNSNRSVYSTIGISGLLFNRNAGTNRNFSTNSLGNVLSSNNTTDDVLPGIDAFITRRKANGHGWEARYFGLYPNDESIQVGNNATHLMPGYNQLGTSIVGTGPTASVAGPTTGNLFNRADTHVLTRQTELNNVEFNILRNTAPRFRALSTEFLFGFRYFQFGETLLHEAINVPNGDPTFVGPDSIGYLSSVENNLYGLQIGARSDYRLRSRLMMHLGFKVGAFSNQVNTRQRVDYRMPDGSIVNPRVAGGTLSGQNFDIGAEDDVKSILGEVDIAFSYQLSGSSRVRAGYRALGISDIAFASNQVKDDFTDASRLTTPYTDDTLILQGAYAGLEFAY